MAVSEYLFARFGKYRKNSVIRSDHFVIARYPVRSDGNKREKILKGDQQSLCRTDSEYTAAFTIMLFILCIGILGT